MIKRRRPIIAILLGLFGVSGLGQFYNGQVGKFLLIQLFSISLAGTAVLLMGSFVGLCIWVLLAIIFTILVAVDAYVSARRIGMTELRWTQRWYVYLVISLIAWLCGDSATAKFKSSYFEAYKIPSASMAPTLVVGDHIIASKGTFEKTEPQRGDIVIFTLPDSPQTSDTDESAVKLMKRIVALPGDKVAVKGTYVFINEEKLFEGNYAQWDRGGIKDFPETQVPERTVFLLGDNRDQSKDSRYYDMPFVSFDRLLGKLKYIYWNSNKLSRVGKDIK